MRRDEVVAVLGRDVARYFLGANRPRVVGVRLPNGNGGKNGKADGGSMPVLAAAVHLSLVELARRSLEGVGWSPASLLRGPRRVARRLDSSKGTPVKAVVAVVGDTAHVLRLEGSNPSGARQLPAQDLSSVAEALGEGSGRVLVLSSPQVFDGLHGPLTASGWVGLPEIRRVGQGPKRAQPLARPDPPSSWYRRASSRSGGRRPGRTRWALRERRLFASCWLLLAQLWGAHRELGAVEARRAAIREQVAPLLETRDSLNELTARVQAMEELEANTPIWTRPLVELAAILPEDTYLTALFASGDTVEIEAAGARAGEAIQALRESGLFAEIRLQGIVERELDEGETVEERFRVWALLPSDRKGAGR